MEIQNGKNTDYMEALAGYANRFGISFPNKKYLQDIFFFQLVVRISSTNVQRTFVSGLYLQTHQIIWAWLQIPGPIGISISQSKQKKSIFISRSTIFNIHFR